jgi:uncharacterized alpha-E superfamily protein
VIGVREGIELRLLGRLLDRANLMPSSAALAMPESSAFQQGLTAAASDRHGLAALLDDIQHLAGTLRDRFSPDMSAAVGPLTSDVRNRFLNARGKLDPLLAALDEIVRFVATLSGLAQENMTRGTGWLFLDLGRRIERGQFVLGAALGPFRQSPIDWDAAMRIALELCDSTITYRSRYLAALQPGPVLDLVLADDSNPRSLAFQLLRLDENLAALPRRDGELTIIPVSQILRDLATVTSQFDGNERAQAQDSPTLVMLRDLLEETGNGLRELSNAITRAYFTHVPAAQALGSARAAARL